MFSLVVIFILIASSLNWFAIGVFQFDIIAGLFGSQSVFISRFIYTLFGLAGIWTLLLLAFKKGHLDFRKNKDIIKEISKDIESDKIASDIISDTSYMEENVNNTHISNKNQNSSQSRNIQDNNNEEIEQNTESNGNITDNNS